MAGKTNARAMSKSQIAAHLANKFGFTKKTGASVLEEIATLAYKECRKGFTLPGIGKLVVVKRKARKGRNPQTGEEIQIPAKTVLKFRIAKAAKVQALGKK
jgi:DNA-binding protein HU-beta